MSLRVADVASSTAQVLVLRIVANLVARAVAALGLLDIIDTLILASVSVLAALTNLGTVLPEQERDSTASKTEESQKSRGPLITETFVHLLSEEDNSGTPETSDTSLCCEGRSGLVLVGIDEVVVGRVVEEDETETNGETTHSRTSPREILVRSPGKDEKTDGNAPA